MSVSPTQSPTNKLVSAVDAALPIADSTPVVIQDSSSAEVFEATVPAAQLAAAAFIEAAEQEKPLQDQEVVSLTSHEDVKESKSASTDGETTAPVTSTEIAGDVEVAESEASEEADEEMDLLPQQAIIQFILDPEAQEIIPGSKAFVESLSGEEPTAKAEKIEQWLSGVEEKDWRTAIERAIQSEDGDLIWDVMHCDGCLKIAETVDMSQFLVNVQNLENADLFEDMASWDIFEEVDSGTLNKLVSNTFDAEGDLTIARGRIFSQILDFGGIDEVEAGSIAAPLKLAAEKGNWDVFTALWTLSNSSGALSSEDLSTLADQAKTAKEYKLATRINAVRAVNFTYNNAKTVSAIAVGALAIGVAYLYQR